MFLSWIGGFKWLLAAGVVIAVLLVTNWVTMKRLEEKNEALLRASVQLDAAAEAIRSRNNLISSMGRLGAEDWSDAERECLAEIARAYDAGVSLGPNGVRDDVAGRQRSGAFGGSVSGGSERGGPS